MTSQKDVLNNSKYIPVLDHGFVGLVDNMGDDNAIVQAARVSYGAGTKKVSEDRGLIRYLLRHLHTTPFEMVDFKFHLKMPIFVMRQWIRHRTASVNEYSGRYSEMTDEFYVPEINRIKPQSQLNKQGSDGDMDPREASLAKATMDVVSAECYDSYLNLLESGQKQIGQDVFEAKGVSRELARIVLPVSNYTEAYWKMNLHNLFHFLKLRMDSHAQWEIQEFANAIYKTIQPIVPVACEAFNDYTLEGTHLSRMEIDFLKSIVAMAKEHGTLYTDDASATIATGMNKREWDEFKTKFGI